MAIGIFYFLLFCLLPHLHPGQCSGDERTKRQEDFLVESIKLLPVDRVQCLHYSMTDLTVHERYSQHRLRRCLGFSSYPCVVIAVCLRVRSIFRESHSENASGDPFPGGDAKDEIFQFGLGPSNQQIARSGIGQRHRAGQAVHDVTGGGKNFADQLIHVRGAAERTRGSDQTPVSQFFSFGKFVHTLHYSMLGRGTCRRRERSRCSQVMKWAAMKLFHGLSGDHRVTSDLVARLSNRIARVTHFSEQFLSCFGVGAEQFCSLFKHMQNLADAPLLFALYIRKLPNAVAASSQVADNRLELATNRLILLAFRAVDYRLEARDELVDLCLSIRVLFKKQAAQRSNASIDHIANARKSFAGGDTISLDFSHGVVKSGQYGFQFRCVNTDDLLAVGESGTSVILRFISGLIPSRKPRYPQSNRRIP